MSSLRIHDDHRRPFITRSLSRLQYFRAALKTHKTLPDFFRKIDLLRPRYGSGVLWWACLSVCLSLCVSVCLCVCLSAIISWELHVRSSAIFLACYLWRGSVRFWQRSDTLCTSGFIDDVMFAHKPRLLDVAAQLKRSAHPAWAWL